MRLVIVGTRRTPPITSAGARYPRSPHRDPGRHLRRRIQQLQSHCFAYIHATEVGGTHPALIEAMGRGAMVLYLTTPENEEAAGDAAMPFTEDTLVDKLRWAAELSEEERSRWGCLAQRRIQERYSWDAVTDAYEQLFEKMRR